MGYAALLIIASLAGPTEAGLQIRFIGNSAFEISDGRATLLIDFPYQPGAFDYMTFEPMELHTRPAAFCLFTHRHADHFDPMALGKVGCQVVAGPPEVITAAGRKAQAGDGLTWHFDGAVIRCLRTEHGNIEHCSYMIHWHGKRFFFSGDVENLDVLGQEQGPLDAVFVPAWLASNLGQTQAKFPTARIVVHHHRTGERLPDCGSCLIPAQGAIFTLSDAPPNNALERPVKGLKFRAAVAWGHFAPAAFGNRRRPAAQGGR